jgi:hypothetical protein
MLQTAAQTAGAQIERVGQIEPQLEDVFIALAEDNES